MKKKDFWTSLATLASTELIEEILEYLIEITISVVFLKVISFAFAISLNVAIKIAYKSFYKNIIQKHIRKEGNDKVEFVKKIFKRRKRMSTIQKILTAILSIFGVGGVVVGLLPEFTAIAQSVSTYVMIATESIAVASGIFLANTNDLTEEEATAKATEKATEKAKKLIAEYEEAKKIVETTEVK